MEILKNKKQLNKIYLNVNKYDIEGLKSIIDCLNKNNSIYSVDFYIKYFKEFAKEAIKLISEFLKNNNSISSINLSWNEIRDEEIKILMESLKYNNSISSIDLSWNEIENKGHHAPKRRKINMEIGQ